MALRRSARVWKQAMARPGSSCPAIAVCLRRLRKLCLRCRASTSFFVEMAIGVDGRDIGERKRRRPSDGCARP